MPEAGCALSQSGVSIVVMRARIRKRTSATHDKRLPRELSGLRRRAIRKEGRRAQLLRGAYCQLRERGHHLTHDPVLSGKHGIAEVADSAQAGRKLNLDPMGRRKIDRVVWVKPEPYSLIGNVVAVEATMKQLAGRTEERRIEPSHNDPPQWAFLFASNRGSVGFDDEAAVGIEPEGKTVAPEPVHREGDVHVLQKRSQLGRLAGIVQP